MSHFSVIVTGPNVADQLQPYHEFECTGTIDQYVLDVDKTEEIRKEYLEHKSTRYKSPNGHLHDPYLNHFYRIPTTDESKKIGSGTGCGHGLSWTSKDWNDGGGYSTRVHFIPDGWEEVKVPTSDIKSLAEWASDYYGMKIWPEFGTEPSRDNEEFKYGFISLEITGEVKRIVDRTNPQKRWDWWQVGGRYSNRLILHNGSRADSALKSQINYDLMQAEKLGQATTRWNDAMAAFGTDEPHKSFEECNHDREMYWAQPRLQAFKENSKGNDSLRWDSPDDFLISREQFIQNAANQALGAFAFLHEGRWAEKGKMGMFACVFNEMSDSEWYQWVADQVRALPDDTLITIVDCHI